MKTAKCFYLEEDLIQKIESIAKLERRSISNCASILLEKAILENNKDLQKNGVEAGANK